MPKPTMKQEYKTKWLELLRSRLLVQGQNDLWEYCHSGEAFCCLGVLQSLTEWDPRKPEYRPENTLMYPTAATEVGFPSSKEKEDFKNVSDKNIQKKLAMLNTDLSFPELADWIEANIEGVP